MSTTAKLCICLWETNQDQLDHNGLQKCPFTHPDQGALPHSPLPYSHQGIHHSEFLRLKTRNCSMSLHDLSQLSYVFIVKLSYSMLCQYSMLYCHRLLFFYSSVTEYFSLFQLLVISGKSYPQNTLV